ncbi:MAG: DUF3052 family protein [Xanthomonadales bacterium]|nr:DUF3052 family protein [Xanthomonadales bacterium]
MAGDSDTPLAKKLGYREGMRVRLVHAPDHYDALVAPLPGGVRFDIRMGPGTDLVHLFVKRAAELGRRLADCRRVLRTEAVVWVSWPKKASGVDTDITEDTVREHALPLGYVDVKVCAVDDTWSGLKLVVRKELR